LEQMAQTPACIGDLAFIRDPTSIKTLPTCHIRSMKIKYKSLYCSRHFSCSWRAENITSVVPRPVQNPHWLSGSIPSSSTCCVSLFNRTLARTLPATERSEIPQRLSQQAWSPLRLYRWIMLASLKSCGTSSSCQMSEKRSTSRRITHTHTMVLQLSGLSRTTQLSQYQKKHSPTLTYCGHQSFLICFIHLLWYMASSLFNLHAWQSFSTISLQVFFGLPLGLAPSTSHSISSPKHCLLFTAHAHTIATCFSCSTKIMSFNPSLSTLYLELYLVA